MALFKNNNSVQNPSVHVGVLIGANFCRNWNPWNLLGVKLIFIKQNLIGVLWGALVEEIVGKNDDMQQDYRIAVQKIHSNNQDFVNTSWSLAIKA